MRPYLELPMMRGERFQVRSTLIGRGRVAIRRARKRAEKADNPRPQKMTATSTAAADALQFCVDCGRIVAGIKPRLQFADPIPTRGKRETRIGLEVLFEALLVELRVVEGVERRRQAPERHDQPQLGGDDVDDETEPYLAREREPGFGFPVDVR